MILTRTTAFVIGALAAASLAGCASAPPLSLEESLGFDKATGGDITGQPPGLRVFPPPGYHYPGDLPYLPPPPPPGY